MKKMKKSNRIPLLLLLVLIVLSVQMSYFSAKAEGIPFLGYDYSITCYPLNADGRTYAINNNKRYIDGSDKCRIISIDGDRVYVSYPTSYGYHEEWFWTSDFTTCELNTNNLPLVNASESAVAYRRSYGDETIGSLDTNDQCYVLTRQNDRTQVVYPLSNGKGYKMGWVNNKELYSDETFLGNFRICSSLDRNKVIDVYAGNSGDGTSIQIYDDHGGVNQQFSFIPVKDNWFAIINIGTGKAVDVTGGVSGSQVNLQLYRVNFSDAQLWKCYKTNKEKEYSFKNKLGYWLNLRNADTSNENRLWVYDNDGTAAMMWKIKKSSATTEKIMDAVWKREFSDDEISWTSEKNFKDFNVLYYTKHIKTENGITYYPSMGQRFVTEIQYLSPETIASMKDFKSRDPDKWEQIKDIWVGDIETDISSAMVDATLDIIGCAIPFSDKIVATIGAFSAEESEWNKFADATPYGQGVKIIVRREIKYIYQVPIPSYSIGVSKPTLLIGEEVSYEYEPWDTVTKPDSNIAGANAKGNWSYKFSR